MTIKELRDQYPFHHFNFFKQGIETKKSIFLHDKVKSYEEKVYSHKDDDGTEYYTYDLFINLDLTLDETFTAEELKAISEARTETGIPEHLIDWDKIGDRQENTMPDDVLKGDV